MIGGPYYKTTSALFFVNIQAIAVRLKNKNLFLCSNQMKKIFVFFLAFLYITTSCEAAVYLHYCMGKQVGFSLFPRDMASCQKCGMKKSGRSMGCCKDEQKIIKTEKTQKATDLSFSVSHPNKYPVPAVFYNYTAFLPDLLTGKLHPAHGPPGLPAMPIYLVNGVFRI